MSGPAQDLHLQRHQFLGGKADHLAQEIRVQGILKQALEGIVSSVRTASDAVIYARKNWFPWSPDRYRFDDHLYCTLDPGLAEHEQEPRGRPRSQVPSVHGFQDVDALLLDKAAIVSCWIEVLSGKSQIKAHLEWGLNCLRFAFISQLHYVSGALQWH